jgi:hypothetical protein
VTVTEFFSIEIHSYDPFTLSPCYLLNHITLELRGRWKLPQAGWRVRTPALTRREGVRKYDLATPAPGHGGREKGRQKYFPRRLQAPTSWSLQLVGAERRTDEMKRKQKLWLSELVLPRLDLTRLGSDFRRLDLRLESARAAHGCIHLLLES